MSSAGQYLSEEEQSDVERCMTMIDDFNQRGLYRLSTWPAYELFCRFHGFTVAAAKTATQIKLNQLRTPELMHTVKGYLEGTGMITPEDASFVHIFYADRVLFQMTRGRLPNPGGVIDCKDFCPLFKGAQAFLQRILRERNNEWADWI